MASMMFTHLGFVYQRTMKAQYVFLDRVVQSHVLVDPVWDVLDRIVSDV